MIRDIYLGSDHAGYKLKHKVEAHLEKKGFRAIDLGIFNIEKPADYPDIAREVAEKVIENNATGILICGSGLGMAITANRFRGVRATPCYTAELAKMARMHNDANVLCLGERVTKEKDALKIVDVFLNTKFESGRHARRVEKIETNTQDNEA